MKKVIFTIVLLSIGINIFAQSNCEEYFTQIINLDTQHADEQSNLKKKYGVSSEPLPLASQEERERYEINMERCYKEISVIDSKYMLAREKLEEAKQQCEKQERERQKQIKEANDRIARKEKEDADRIAREAQDRQAREAQEAINRANQEKMDAYNKRVKEINRQRQEAWAQWQREQNAERRRRYEAYLKKLEDEKQKLADQTMAEISQTTQSLKEFLAGKDERDNALKNKDTQGEVFDGLDRTRKSPALQNFDDEYMQARMTVKDIPCISIGQYHGQSVCKKGDTIIVAANNKKYLLSSQQLLDNKNYNGDYSAINGISNGIITHDGWYLGKDLSGVNNVIGYITTKNQWNQSTAPGEMARFAENAVGCEFHEISCDITIYNKFLNFCKWQICQMTNNINVSNLSYSDYQTIINNDIKLNKEIIVLKANDIGVQFLNFAIGEKTDNMVDLNTSATDFVKSSIINAITNNGSIKGEFGNCVVSVSNYIDIAMQKETPDDLRHKTFAQLFERKDEKIKDMYTSEFGKLLTKLWHGAYDVVSDCAGKEAAAELLFYNMLPELVGISAMGAANSTIKYIIAPQYKKDIETYIDNCRIKKGIVEKYRNKYQPLLEKNQNNCLEYTKTINQLREEVFNYFGDENTQEVMNLMKDYVFGEESIPQCSVLSSTNLKPVIAQSTPQKEVQQRREPIGKLGKEIVYYSHDSIFVGEKVYLLFLQPRQDAFSNKITKFVGKIKMRYFIMYDGKSSPKESDFRNENIIGWVDYDYNNKYTFTPRKDDGVERNRVEGINLFGSLYIGPCNPTYPNGHEIYTFPYQDNVDEAAMEHDKCYADRGVVDGESDAFFNTGVTDCDTELVMRCLSTLQISVEDNMTQNAIDYIKSKLDWSKSSHINDLANLGQITDPIQRAKYVATFFLLISSGKGWGLIFKTINSTSKTLQYEP